MFFTDGLNGNCISIAMFHVKHFLKSFVINIDCLLTRLQLLGYIKSMIAQKIIFYNQKGGVGKTTAAVNLGSSLADLGYRVLLIDFDAQGNLTGAVSGDNRKTSIYHVVTGQTDAKDAIQPTFVKNLYLIPGSLDMAGLGVELVDEENREYFLKRALSSIEGEFDYILLDCPPSLGLETMNALVWCNKVIIPLQCEYLAMEGLNLIMRTLILIFQSLVLFSQCIPRERSLIRRLLRIFQSFSLILFSRQ